MAGTSGGIEQRRLVDASWLAILPLALNIVSVAANGYIIRTLGENGYGSLVVALGLSGATTLVSNLGMRALYTKSVAGADDADTETLMAEQLGLRLRLAILAGLMAVGAAWLLYPNDHIILYCTALQSAGLLATVAWTVMADVLNAREQFRTNASIAFRAGIALTALSVLAAAVGGGAVLVAAAYLAGPMVNLGMQFRAMATLGLRVRFGGATPGRYRQLLRDSRALAANDILNVANTRAEGVWAPLLFGKGLMGVYAAGTLPQSRLGMAADGVATAYFPAMATAHRDGDVGRMQRQATDMFTLLLAVGIPLALFTFIGAPYLGGLLFPAPEQIGSAALATFVTRASAFAIPLGAISLGMRYALQAAGQHSRNAKDQMVSTVIAAMLVLGLALSVGVQGLVIGLVLRSILNVAFQLKTLSAHYPGLIAALPFGRILGTCTGLALMLLLTIGPSGTPGLAVAIIWSVLGGLAYGGLAYSVGLIAKPGAPAG